jgi:hypothetical protein
VSLASRIVFVVLVAIALGACGATFPQDPASAGPAQTNTQRVASARPWMLPEAGSEDLLYVFTENSAIYVFSYPTGKLVGSLTGFSGIYGECVDAAGDVWVTNFSPPEIIEYAHGATSPKATLSDAGSEPWGCSVDPTTGDLAVANYDGGDIAIFKDAQGTPTTYSDPDFAGYMFCAYDNAGNLFADNGLVAGEVAELNAGSSELVTVPLNQQIHPQSMQWDGKYLATVDGRGAPQGPIPVARVQVTGSGGEIVSTTQLRSRGGRRPTTAVQYFVDGSAIMGPDRYRHAGDRLAILFWHYPGGGKPFKVIRGTWSANGAVVSAATRT